MNKLFFFRNVAYRFVGRWVEGKALEYDCTCVRSLSQSPLLLQLVSYKAQTRQSMELPCSNNVSHIQRPIEYINK